MSYRILKEEATADVAYLVTGKTLEEVFNDSAAALCQTMVKMKSVGNSLQKEIKMNERDASRLLHKFLEEIVFLKDSCNMIFSSVKVKITEGNEYTLSAVLKGEEINNEKHEMGTDVKAVTLHMFELKKTAKKWQAKFVLDI